MKTFCINTCTQKAQLVVFNHDTIIAKSSWDSNFDETTRILTKTQKLFHENNIKMENIKKIMVCCGPGGFTSTRIGVGIGNILAFAKNILIGTCDVFDLYSENNAIIIITCNNNEAWIKLPKKNPQFVSRDVLKFPPRFFYTGVINKQWETYLTNKGGHYIPVQERFPYPSSVTFHHKIIRPWYYKEAHITWSKK